MSRIKLDLPESFVFATDLQLYIGHINYGGHLDNAQLITLVSEARVRFLKSMGYGELDIEGLGIVVADHFIQYKSEGFHGETIRIQMQPQDFNKYGFDLFYRIDCLENPRELARGKQGIVFVNKETKKVAHVPPAFLGKFGKK
jgi:acyl-CoA thioester hydrolase